MSAVLGVSPTDRCPKRVLYNLPGPCIRSEADRERCMICGNLLRGKKNVQSTWSAQRRGYELQVLMHKRDEQTRAAPDLAIALLRKACAFPAGRRRVIAKLRAFLDELAG